MRGQLPFGIVQVKEERHSSDQKGRAPWASSDAAGLQAVLGATKNAPVLIRNKLNTESLSQAAPPHRSQPQRAGDASRVRAKRRLRETVRSRASTNRARCSLAVDRDTRARKASSVPVSDSPPISAASMVARAVSPTSAATSTTLAAATMLQFYRRHGAAGNQGQFGTRRTVCA